MREIQRIESLDNKRLKTLLKLKKKKHREEEGLFLAEGTTFLDYPEDAAFLLYHEKMLGEERMQDFDCPILELSAKCFQKMSSQEHSQGIIVVYKMRESSWEKLGDKILVLDDVQDPGNLGTILRLSDAAGFDKILLTDASADIYNEKVVRSSMGSIFHVDCLRASRSDILSYLAKEGFQLVATSLQEDSISYMDVELAEKNAFVFGNEGHGVSKDFLEAASQKIIIPISGKAESLNVAMALGIVIFSIRDLKMSKK